MSVVSVNARSFILALFIRDDGERFLLGDKGYDFKDSQLHFAANTIENDEVVKQGTDGVMVAGQVRRSSVQSFDGFVGDATMAKETIEQMRRDFFAFFVKGHHFRVVYIDCNRNAWQRKGGYLVDAPEVKELWQIHPEYHVGLNFEDVNYYSYDEDASGEEILSNLVDVPVSTAASGGLVWDEDGAISEDAEVEYITETAEASGRSISISDAAEAPLASFQIDGETSQNGTPTPSAPVPVNTVTGENVVKICGKNLFNKNAVVTGALLPNGTIDTSCTYVRTSDYIPVKAGETYRLSGIPGGWGPVGIYDSNKTFISRTYSGNGQYVIPSNAAYARPVIVEGDLGTCQLELGSAATTYEPYQSQSYEVNLGSIELCKIGDYQDYILNDGGTWKKHKAIGKVILDGSETGWTRTFVDGVYRFVRALPEALNAEGRSTYFKTSHFHYLASGNEVGGAIFNAGNIGLMYSTVDTSIEQFSAWLSTNNVSIYYALATPTDTEITNEALVAQLEALRNNARTYAGTNNVFTITPNEQGTLEISYYTEYQPVVVGGGYVWEAGGTGGATVVVNNSIDNVSPIWKVYGPTLNPQLENSTTGETIEYVGMVGDGQTLTIDMGEQTASLDGLNVISDLVGDFISLAPGANRLIYSVTGDAGASEIGWSEIVG